MKQNETAALHDYLETPDSMTLIITTFTAASKTHTETVQLLIIKPSSFSLLSLIYRFSSNIVYNYIESEIITNFSRPSAL